MTDHAMTTTPDNRQVALLKAVGLDRVAPEQRELALSIADRYGLDLFLKHLVLIEGRPYITRDGLLHVAHRSGNLDGIETSEPTVVDGFWRSTCSVYRKDMSRPFTYTGRYPTDSGNKKFAPEMAVKVGEVMALRRAFDVSAPVMEERWDVEIPAEPPAPTPTLAERAAARRAEVEQATEPTPVEPDPQEVFDGEGLFTDADAPKLALARQAFVDRIRAAGIDDQHASTVRLAMFPDPAYQLNDEDRGALWLQLESEQKAAVG